MEKSEIGIVYLAFGRSYLAMALVSLLSARKTNPDIPVCILTNVCEKVGNIDGWIENFDVWKYLNLETTKNRDIKTQLYKYTPFKKTLYIDSDTIIVGDLSNVKILLDYFDICVKLNTTEQIKKGRTGHKVLDGTALINELPHWNGGVVFFKISEKTEQFFDLWNKYYKIHNLKYDQISLVEAIFRSNCRILSLDSRWNYKRKHKSIPVKKNVKILHYVTDMTNKDTPQIDTNIIENVLLMSRKLPGGDLMENYHEIEIFFKKINAFRNRKSFIQIVLKKLKKKLVVKK